MGGMDEMLTSSMQNYLETIWRLSREKGYTRISELSGALHVQPPAATRMVQKLAEMKLIKYEKYGVLVLGEEGKRMGDFLLERHGVVDRFLKILGVTDTQRLEDTEKMEHTIGRETLRCITLFIEFAQENPRFFAAYALFKKRSEARE
jgi:Mn-dependent DtxR family transcriptional regulator